MGVMRLAPVLMKAVFMLMILDKALSNNPCYKQSDQAKFDALTNSIASINKEVSALRLSFKGRKLSSTEKCEAGWTKYKNHCYVLRSDKKSWYHAVESCDADGGSLVYIDDSSENSWVAQFCRGDDHCWIGLHDLKEGHWLWSHSWSTPKFKNWNRETNEPNGGTTENCAFIYAPTERKGWVKRWNDSVCHHKAKYICKKAPRSMCFIVVLIKKIVQKMSLVPQNAFYPVILVDVHVFHKRLTIH